MSVSAINDTAQTTAAQATTATATDQTTSDFSTYLNNETTTLDAIFQKASETYGVSENLLKAIAKQESDFDPNSTSSSGAMGIMQLMPGTAESLGVTDAYNPEQNIMGGAKYISEMLERYNGDVSLALAAYNAGSGNVAKYGGIPPFEETQNYVVKVLGYMADGVTVPDTAVTAGSSTLSAADAYTALSSSASFTTENLNTLKTGLEVAVSLMNRSSDSTATSNADTLFSYEDYLRFLDFYIKLLETTQTASSEASTSDSETTDSQLSDTATDNTAASSAAYAARQITLNKSIINLFTGTTENI